ncbi:class I adenylate cyclase [Methylophaga sp.]|uniref:class I adenylate cyclase n=1 Tax=Methylophaga sp. TaxID=2024840 RepID=UPI003F699080
MDRVQALRFFQAHNHERIRRLIEISSPRHGLIYQILPLLFHINSKVMPGYISDDTPAGLIDYRPDKTTVDKAQELEINFKYRRRALRRYPLRGLYLINPQGLLHDTDSPLLQLWVLHSDKLKEDQRLLLLQKLKMICNWMKTSGLRITYKLLAEADLAANKLQGWESDLLYRSGMVLGGSVPYWWLTSPDDDKNYPQAVAQLRSQRMLNQVSFTDFGEPAKCDAAMLFQNACQAVSTSLHHAVDGLELRYLLSTLPQTQSAPLSTLFKQQLYQQQSLFLTEDISHLKLLDIEQHAHDEHAREALYLASSEQLSKPVRLARYPWRRDFISTLVKRWGWSDDKLEALDQRDYAANKNRFERIGESCKSVLELLVAYNHNHGLSGDHQLAELRKLYQKRFKPAADIIDCLPRNLRPAINSERLFLQRFANHSDWLLSYAPIERASQNALFRHDNLVHILAWAINNHILSRSNWLSVTDHHQKVTTNTVVGLCQQLFRSTLADSDLMTDTAKLITPESLQQIILVSNLERHPNDKLTQQGLQLSSKQNDPLNYTSFKNSLVVSVDGLLLSSHGQWHSFSFDDNNAPLELLVYLLNWQPEAIAEEQISGWCPTPIFGQTISNRMMHLTAQACRHYQQFPESGRLLINFAGRPYSLQWHEQAEYIRRPSSHDVWQALADNRKTFTANALDSYQDLDGLLNYLLQKQSNNCITVFIYLEQNTIICYLLDELGNLIRQQFQHLTESTLIAHLHKFLSDIKTSNEVAQLRFYRLSREQQAWQLTAIAAPKQTLGYLPITVTMATPALDAECNVVCGKKHFIGRADDPAFFGQIHSLVLSLRKQNQRYPVYLNKLTFADVSAQPTAVYMQQKYRLEQLFNPD